MQNALSLGWLWFVHMLLIAPEWSVTTRFVPEPRCSAPRLQGVPAARGFSLAARNVYASADMCAACSLFAAPPWPPSMFS